MFVGLTVLAVYMKGEMTLCGGVITTGSNCLLWLILFQFIWGVNNTLHLLIAIVVVFFMGIFIVYDTQMIVGGKHKRYQLDPNDFAIAAIILYNDIITVFIYML